MAADRPEQDGPKGSEPEGQESKITLDRYMSRRRPPARSNWAQIVSMIAMLAGLVMIFMYKDRCGVAASSFFGGAQQETQQAPKTPAHE